MKIVEGGKDGMLLRMSFDSGEESLLYLLKSYLEKHKDCDIVGIYKEHYLIEKSEMVLRTKTLPACDVFLEIMSAAKGDLKDMKIP